MPERRIIHGPDRSSVVYVQTPLEKEGLAPYQPPITEAKPVYKPYANGMTTEKTHQGFPKVGIQASIRRTVYFSPGELEKAKLPLTPQDADITGLRITNAGLGIGLNGASERRIILEGTISAVQAYDVNFRVKAEEPAKIVSQSSNQAPELLKPENSIQVRTAA